VAKEEKMVRFGIMDVIEIQRFGRIKYVVRNIRTGRTLEEFDKWKMAVEWAKANRDG
jgi:hypothetical protein